MNIMNIIDVLMQPTADGATVLQAIILTAMTVSLVWYLIVGMGRDIKYMWKELQDE